MDIGIATDGLSRSDAVIAAVREIVDEPAIGEPESFASAALDLLLLSGWDDLRTVVDERLDVPVLVVDEPAPFGPVPHDAVAGAVEAIRTDTHTTRAHTPLSVRLPDREALAIADAMVMTQEPATISEYAIRRDGTAVGEYRADGLVAATPSASSEYARAAGGPIVDTGIRGIVLVPIAPYRTDPDHWVLQGSIDIEVLRDTGVVHAFLDGDDYGPVPQGEQVRITPGSAYRTVRVPQSYTPLPGTDDDRE